jgi:deazaflavin-dependent oxidoreductase (nitroreductase family)
MTRTRVTGSQASGNDPAKSPPATTSDLASAGSGTPRNATASPIRTRPCRTNAPRGPRWFIRLAWSVHRGVYRVTGGRLGLWRPKANRWGTLRLTCTGRRTGRQRSVILGYFEDGPNLVTMAMNGGGDGEPAWWLNLRARPDARIDLVDGPRLVTARAATGDERATVGPLARH